MSAPLHTFTSHISGKNAKVFIYPDRIEWEQPRGVSGAKVAAGLMTLGTSMLVTGVKGGKSGSEMIPIRTISSVATKRDGILNTIVQVITSGNTIDFRVSHAEAKGIREILNRLILEGPPSAATVTPVPAASDSIADQLQQLGSLRARAHVTDDDVTPN